MDSPHCHECHNENGQSDHQQTHIRMLARDHHAGRPSEGDQCELDGDTGIG